MSKMSAYKVRINTHTADSSAIILVANGLLIGVLSELVDKGHGLEQGKWTIEVAPGIEERPIPATFSSAEDAANWLSTRITGGTFDLSENVPELR